MNKVINWIIEPFTKPNYLVTTWDNFKMGLIVLVGLGLIFLIFFLVYIILEKIGIIK